jgi:hypothetical protein
MRNFYSICGVVAVLGVAACGEPLLVENVSQPDRERALTRPPDLETFIANSYNTINNATLGGSNDALQPGMLVMGLESFSGNANFDMNVRGGVPRGMVDNSRGNSGQDIHLRDWTVLHRAARSAAIGLGRIRAGVAFLSPPRDERNKAFAWFVMGLGVGNLALVYDSVTQIRWDDPPDQVKFPLLHYNAAMTLALQYLDSAIVTAQAAPTGADGFPLPATWLNGATGGFAGGAVSRDDFVRFIRSYKARFRASVARDTVARAAVDWDAVMADAQAGITTDHRIATNPAAGWNIVWPTQHYLFQSWHQMWAYVVGMADSSGAYDAWLATTLTSKAPFLVQTRDRRFPAGGTRAAQNTNSPTVPPATLYFRNRPAGQDVLTANTLANSYYDHYRFQAWRTGPPTNTGPYPVMTRAEMNGLIAEGAIRRGLWALAAQYIDSSRVRNNLPSVAGIADLTTPVPGGAACVPRVPAPPSYTSTVCGNIMEAMKWEYRMETAFTGYGMWYLAGRGWGDLPEGTPVHHPVPYQELDVRTQASYNLGGVGLVGGAPRGTYGF